jgi:hypothetical protein
MTSPESSKMNNALNLIYSNIRGATTPRKTIKAVHFSDPHVDTVYRIGADSKCNTYLCCRDENGYPTEPERKAKEWGSYLCDLPVQTF